ncbi:hypothetical protein LTR49_028055 [Elasticomyces elasticus]|nr:hypothetical protein LTR49_028055 [Elasticomyces elasticus]
MYTFLSVLALVLPGRSNAKVQRAGVNIAGFDFGVDTNGNSDFSDMVIPLASQGGPDGIGQMQHFASIGLNIFRLPVQWQYLTNNVLGGSLDSSNVAVYDELVQGCLDTGALCIIDVHNYARWYGGIVGQSGVTTEDLSSLWGQLGAKYASQSNVVMGIMNEPHDLVTSDWATTVQACVTAIRNAGANDQIILLPGNDYDAVGGYAEDSAPALAGITNPDGNNANLIYDVHQYLDGPNHSGVLTDCTSNGVDNLQDLANWLRSNGRVALLSETGGGNTASCDEYVCAELDWMNYNADVYLSWVGWAAGSFDATYNLTETPTYADGKWTDTSLVTSCVAGKFTS